MILCNPEKFLPSKKVNSLSLTFGLLNLGLISSKISMIPIFLIQVLIFLRIIKINWGLKYIKKSIFYLVLPFLIFYLPIITYTWFKSGSPFGPLLSSLFLNEVNIDPILRAANGEIGNQNSLIYFGFFALTKWSPFIWIACLLTLHKKIKLNTKVIFLFILSTQSLLIWIILPNSPRFYGGIHYVGLLIVFVELIPQLFQRYRIFFLSIFLFSSIPWFLLDIYYSYPLISKAFLKSEKFKKDYIPFYEDFLVLDNLLEKDSNILVFGTRINTFHAPRKVYHYKKNISTKPPSFEYFYISVVKNDC